MKSPRKNKAKEDRVKAGDNSEEFKHIPDLPRDFEKPKTTLSSLRSVASSSRKLVSLRRIEMDFSLQTSTKHAPKTIEGAEKPSGRQ